MKRAELRLQTLEGAASDYLAALARLKRARGGPLAEERAAAALAARRRLDDARRVAGPLTAAGRRVQVEIHGRGVDGATGRVDREGYGGAALGGSIHRVKSLTPRQVETATAYAALSEFAASSGGGGPVIAERVDLPAGRDGAAARLRAIEAQALVDQAERAALCLGDLVGRYGVRAAPATLRAAVSLFLSCDGSGGRRAIGRLDLMRGVCLGGATLAEILTDAGWAVNNQTRRAAGVALGEALDAVDLAWGGAARRFCGGGDISVRAKSA